MYSPAEAPAPAKATKGTKAAAAPKAKAKAKPEMDTLADKIPFLTMKNDETCGFHWKTGWLNYGFTKIYWGDFMVKQWI